MTAMWADTALHQMVRFEEAMDTYAAARVDYEFRAAFHERGDSPEWASEYAAASQYLTQHQLWNVGAERYFLLHASHSCGSVCSGSHRMGCPAFAKTRFSGCCAISMSIGNRATKPGR